jgi:cytochrome c-type biogenesis protein CcmH/NrfG/TolB-like protein
MRCRAVLTIAAIVLGIAGGHVEAATKRSLLVTPFETTALAREEAWVGDGIAELLTLGFVQHPAFVLIERGRLAALGDSGGGEAGALKAARGLRVDVVVFGDVRRDEGTLVVRPRYVEFKGADAEPATLEEVVIPDGEFLTRVPPLPGRYLRALRIRLTEDETRRLEEAARPTKTLRAFQQYVSGRVAMLAGTPEGHDAAADMFARAIDIDSAFVVAQYALGAAHQALGNRWKAAAQFRASTQLDPLYPEPYKALGDLFLAAPRRLFDQAVEAYSKAIELRPFYADAYVGLGDAKAAKGDVDGAVAAYQQALVHNPLNPRMYASLGKIYFSEKGQYFEAVKVYKRAIELDPNFLEARLGLGEVYEDKGLYKEAIAEYQRAVELDEKHTGARYNLALVYEKVDPKEAITLWERYIELASPLPAEKDWVEVAHQHVRKLQGQIKN